MRIPVSTAKSVANKHDLKQCLLIGWDGEQVHIVTYGKTIADCAQAAKAREFWKGHIREFSFKGDIPPNPSSSEQDALREALKPFAEKAEYADAIEAADDDYVDCAPFKAGDYRKARAALTASPKGHSEASVDIHELILLARVFEADKTDENQGSLVAAMSHAADALEAQALQIAGLREALEEATDQLWHLAKDGDENYLVKRCRTVLSKQTKDN
jgi:hypothetical protein